jgi:hypothetical protein
MPARKDSDTSDNESLPSAASTDETTAIANASDSDESDTIRATNAYTGATNSIGSVHQRHWFMTLDKTNSGFVKATSGERKGKWISPGQGMGFEAFFVQGAAVERSIITGRNSEEVMSDEGVEGYRERGMWRAILE